MSADKERQLDTKYMALNTGDGVKRLLRDVHALDARQYLGDTAAIDLLVDLATAIRLAQLTERQSEALRLVYVGDLTQKAAGERMGIAQKNVSELVDRAVESVADVYYYWASHDEKEAKE